MTCVAFSIKFAKTNQKFAENSEFKFVKIIHYYSKLFTGVLKRDLRRAIPRAARAAGDAIVATASQPMASAGALFESCWLGAANQ